MSVTNGVITAPVRLATDVATTIGASAILSAVCTSNNVNKWATKKPVVNPSATPNRAEQTYACDNWWNGSGTRDVAGMDTTNVYATALGTGSNDYSTYSAGIMNILTNFNSCFLGRLRNQSGSWTWHKPTGTIGTAPYRLLDFNGYYHSARCPFPQPTVKTGISISGGYYSPSIPTAVLDGSLELTNMGVKWMSNKPTLSKFYVAALFVRGSYCFWNTAAQPLDYSGTEPGAKFRITVPNSTALIGDAWNVYLFLTDTRVSSIEEWSKGRTSGVNVFALANGAGSATFASTADPITIDNFLAYWRGGEGVIPSDFQYSFTAYNTGGSAITPSSIVLQIKNKTSGTVDKTITVTSASIPTGTSGKVFSGSARYIYPGSGYQAVVTITYTYSGSTKTATATVDCQ